MRIWRITAAEFADTAFSGLGAEKYGGRFNSAGKKVVYASGALSLAMLELLVQANSRLRLRDHLHRWTEIEEDDVQYMAVSDLPSDWNALPYRSASQAIGDRWLDTREKLVLGVPSVIVPLEWNYLINPEHPEFGSLQFSPATSTQFDSRLFKLERRIAGARGGRNS